MSTKRVTVRLEDSLIEMIQQKCGESGCDTSFVIRESLTNFLSLEKGGEGQNATSPSPVLPPQAHDRTPRYMAFSGSLRDELKRQYVEILAASHVATKHFPKTEWVRRLYAGLLAELPNIELE